MIITTYMSHIAMFNYRELPRALEEFEPDMVIYNAGTDVLKGDPLGVLDITPDVREDLFDILHNSVQLLSTLFHMLQGVKERDRLVFSEVRSREIPIVMVTSGGYQVFIIVRVLSQFPLTHTHTHTH